MSTDEMNFDARMVATPERIRGRLAGERNQLNLRHAMLGGLAGLGLGVLAGILLTSGLIPTMEALQSMGIVLPLMVGVFVTGIGAVAGSFVDLLDVSNDWRQHDS